MIFCFYRAGSGVFFATAFLTFATARPALAGSPSPLPTGGTVAQGTAPISTDGTTTTINQWTANAVINWQSFSIAKGHIVNFVQPTSTSATLNRVIGNDKSIIAGALNANGRVFIVNSAGVLFTGSANVNVGGLVASTLNISDANFMAGKYVFQGHSDASVVNRGRINAQSGGYVALLGKTVENDGAITATMGTVALASGRKITLNFEGNSLLDVTVDKGALNALVSNRGAIIANGGRVIMTAKAADHILSEQVNTKGLIQAHSMSALMGGHAGGFSGYGNGYPGGHGHASGGHGHGYMHLGPLRQVRESAGSTDRPVQEGVINSGTIDVSAPKTGNGGTVQLTGKSVTLSGRIDASAVNGNGGTITVSAAKGTIDLLSAATLDASARYGNGGAISLIARGGAANVAGTLDASSQQGNGGTIETSGNSVSVADGAVITTKSAYGQDGMWTIDPTNFTIGNGGSPLGTSGIGVTTLQTNLKNGNVTIRTSSTANGTDAGDINVNAAISWAANTTLTLNAIHNVNVNKTITATGTGSGLVLNAGNDVTIGAALSLANSFSATATAGSININAAVAARTLSLNAAQDINIGAAITPTGTGGSFSLTAGNNVNIGAALNIGTNIFSATATAGNININAPISWSMNTLTLNAGANIYINSIMTAGNTPSDTASLNASYGSGTNSDGSAIGLHLATSAQGGSTGTINFSGGGSVTLQGQNYTVITNETGLQNAAANLAGYYVLGNDISGLSYSDLQPLGFSSGTSNAGTFASSFNGFGHTLSLAAVPGLTIGNAVTLPSTVTNTNITLSSIGDLTVNAPVTWSSGLLTLAATNNVYVNSAMTATGTASFAASYGNGTNGNGTPMGLYTGVSGQNTFTGTIDFSGSTGAVTLNGNSVTLIRSMSDFLAIGSKPQGYYALAENLTASTPLSGSAIASLSGALNGFGHTITGFTISDPSDSKSVGVIGTLTGSLSNIGFLNLTMNVSTTGNAGVPVGTNSGGSIVDTFAAGNVNISAKDITIASPLSWNSANTQTLTATDTINIVAPVSWSSGTLTATAANNINIDAPVTWSAGTLTLNAGANIYVDAAMTATGAAGLNAKYGTGTNSDGSLEGLYLQASTQGGYAGKIGLSGTGGIVLQNQTYTALNSEADIAAAASTGGYYVLGSDIGGLSYAEFQVFGFASSSTFAVTLNGLGHTLTLAPTDLTISEQVSLASNVTNTNFVLTSSGDLTVNAPISWSTNLLTLQAANNIYINNVLTATGNASFAALYGTGTNADNSPMGLYTAMGTQGSIDANGNTISTGTFVGKINFSSTGTVNLEGLNYSVIKTTNQLGAFSSTGNYVLGNDLASAGPINRISFSGNFNGFGHVVDGLTAGGAQAGLFASVGSTSVISNLGITNASINSLVSPTAANTGFLADLNNGSIVNSFAGGSTTGFSFVNYGADINLGGLVGLNNGLIANSYAYANLTAATGQVNSYSGGLVGVNNGYIYGSYAGSDIVTSAFTGGFAGVNRGTIARSHSGGQITIADKGAGGVTIDSMSGGFAGLNIGTINNSYTTTSISLASGSTGATATTAGFAGENDGTISNAYSAGTLLSSSFQGQLAGFVYDNSGTGHISSVYSASVLPSGLGTNAAGFSFINAGTISTAYWDSSRAGGTAEAASSAIILTGAQAQSLSSYSGFDAAYWKSSEEGRPILYTMPVKVLPVANTALQYGSAGTALTSNFTVIGLQWGDTAANVFTYAPSANVLSQSGFVNAGTYSLGQIVTGSIYSAISGAITIAPKELTLAQTGIVADKTYDATTNGTINVTAANNGLIGLVGGETLTANYSGVTFLDKNAGAGKTADVTVTLGNGTGGGLASNYVVVNAMTTASIAQATLVANYTASDKIYDGTTTTSISGTIASGILGADQVSLSTTGNFANANAGTGKQVTASLTGSDAANYMLVTAAPVLAAIDPRPVELSGAVIAGTGTTVPAGGLFVTNLVAGDSVGLSGSVGIADAAHGIQPITNFSGLSLLGNPNYTLKDASGNIDASGSVAVLTSLLPQLTSAGLPAGVTETSTATSLTLNQSVATAIINWSSFNIAPGYSVTFNQPGPSSVAINRVTGNEMSIIAGTLTANGRVFIINSAGVLFAAGSSVNVGGLVASTQDIDTTNSDFANGKYVFGTNAATGSITVQGNITANPNSAAFQSVNANANATGYAAFLGNGIATQGTISAPGGTVLLAGGEGITLTTDTGASSTGTGNLTGYTIATADKSVSVGGTIDVSSTAGNGGTIITQGSQIALSNTLQLLASGAPQYANGSFLIQSNGDLTVGASGLITGGNLSRLLGQINVSLNAAAGTTLGNIDIDDPVAWSAHTLGLNAAGSVFVNTAMTATGTAGLEASWGSGTNADGSQQSLFMAFGTDTNGNDNGTFKGKINFSGSGSISLDGQSYQVISSLAQLASLNGKSTNYVLGNDLDQSATNITYNSAVISSFSGTLDGFGHVINKLTINDSSGSSSDALFGTLGSAGTNAAVRNLGLSNVNITGSGGNTVSGLAGQNFDTLINDFVTGTLSSSNRVSGLVGTNGAFVTVAGSVLGPVGANIENSYVNVTLTGGYSSGGLVTTDRAGTILNSYAAGSLTATHADDLGGLVGLNYGTIDNSWSNVTLTSTFDNGSGVVGGLVGLNSTIAGVAGLIMNNSHSFGAIYVTDASVVGGIVGTNAGVIMGTVDGIDHGDAYYTVNPNAISYVYETGDIHITITANQTGLFTNYSAGIGQGSGFVDGKLVTGAADYFYAKGNIYIDNESTTAVVGYVGGLIGGCRGNCSIDHAFYPGTITLKGPNFVHNTIGQLAPNQPNLSVGADVHYDPPPQSLGTNTNTNTSAGTNTGTSTNTGTGQGVDNAATGSIAGANRSAGPGVGTGGTNANAAAGNASQGSPQSAAGAVGSNAASSALQSAGLSTTGSIPQSSIDANIDSNIDIEDQPAQSTSNKSSERKRNARTKTAAVGSKKLNPAPNMGATIRSIEINGEHFDLKDVKPGTDAQPAPEAPAPAPTSAPPPPQ